MGGDLVVRLGDWSARKFLPSANFRNLGVDREAVKCFKPAARACLSELELTRPKSAQQQDL